MKDTLRNATSGDHAGVRSYLNYLTGEVDPEPYTPHPRTPSRPQELGEGALTSL